MSTTGDDNHQIMIIELLLLLLQTLIKRFDSSCSYSSASPGVSHRSSDNITTLHIYPEPNFPFYRFTAHIRTTHTHPNCPTLFLFFAFRFFLFRTGSWSLGHCFTGSLHHICRVGFSAKVGMGSSLVQAPS